MDNTNDVLEQYLKIVDPTQEHTVIQVNKGNEYAKRARYIIKGCTLDQYHPEQINPCISCKHAHWRSTSNDVSAICLLSKDVCFKAREVHFDRCNNWSDTQDDDEI